MDYVLVRVEIPKLKHFFWIVMIVKLADGPPRPSPLSTSGKMESSQQVSVITE